MFPRLYGCRGLDGSIITHVASGESRRATARWISSHVSRSGSSRRPTRKHPRTELGKPQSHGPAEPCPATGEENIAASLQQVFLKQDAPPRPKLPRLRNCGNRDFLFQNRIAWRFFLKTNVAHGHRKDRAQGMHLCRNDPAPSLLHTPRRRASFSGYSSLSSRRSFCATTSCFLFAQLMPTRFSQKAASTAPVDGFPSCCHAELACRRGCRRTRA